MNEGVTSTRARLVVLAIAVLLPLEILAVMVWLFMPLPGIVAAVPLGALALGLAYERRAAWWIAAPIFAIQGAANVLALLGKVGGLHADRGRPIAASIGPIILNLGVNAAAIAPVILFFSQGVRRRFFRDDLVPRI